MLPCGAVIATAACFPMLAHSTRVQEGVSFAVTTGAHVMTDSAPAAGDRDVNLRPNFMVQLAVSGRSPDHPEGIGYRVAGGIGLTGRVADAYLELPSWYLGALDAGVGVAAQWGYLRMAIPYVQFGGPIGRNWHWFTSHGFALVDRKGWTRTRGLWMPTLGLSHATAGRDQLVFVTAVIGGLPAMDVRKCFIWCFEDTEVVKRTTVMIGLNGARVIRRLPWAGGDRRKKR